MTKTAQPTEITIPNLEIIIQPLQDEIPPLQYNTWIRPLHAVEGKQNALLLFAPNRFVLDWINERCLNRIMALLEELSETPPRVELQIGNKSTADTEDNANKVWVSRTHASSPLAY